MVATNSVINRMLDCPAMEIVNAIAIKDESKFDALDLPSQDIQIEYRITTPFMVKAAHDEDEMKDVVIRGPVYVGDEDMLDRHNELVDYEALDAAWDKYAKNPVILYNHSKTYGVIGRMTNFAMEDYEDYGMVPVGTAQIDSGEKDIVRKIRKGMLKAFSIGFVAKAAVKVCQDKDEDCYIKFTEIDWVETSVVDVPASPGALFGVEKKFSFLDSSKVKSCGGGEGCTCDSKKSQTCDCPEGECKDPENCIGVDRSTEDMTSSGKNSNEKEQVGTDIFTTEEEALARAEELGCSGTHSMVNDEGQTLYMPCSSHDDYESSTGDEPQENSASTDSVKNPLAHSDESPEEQKMSEEVTEIVEEEVVEEAVPTEEAPVELSESTEEVVTKSEDEAEASEEEVADEEPAEEEVEEEAVEEEAVEEEADDEADDGEKSIDASPVAVLMEVVTVLKDLDARIAGMEASITATEELSAEVESLKAIIAERDETISTLTTEKQVAEEEAALEAEVSKRVAERLATIGVEESAPAQRKSVSTADPNPLPVEKTGVTRFDPTPNVSPGMNGLARWLEANISGNRS